MNDRVEVVSVPVLTADQETMLGLLNQSSCGLSHRDVCEKSGLENVRDPWTAIENLITLGLVRRDKAKGRRPARVKILNQGIVALEQLAEEKARTRKL